MNPTTETTLRFTGDYPVTTVWLLAFGLAAAMWFLYRRELKFVGSAWGWVPAALRCLAVFLLVLALSGPVMRRETTQRQLGRVVLAVDTSASMKLEDEGGVARLLRAEKMLLGGTTPLLKKLTETQDVELVLLRGQQTQRVWWNRQKGKDVSGDLPGTFEVQADAPITNLDNALRDALDPRGARRMP